MAHPTGASLRMILVGANPTARGFAIDPLGGHSNYFLGNDPAEWHTDVPNYARVQFDDVYPGIDVVYYGTNQRQLEFDFVVQPGADPSVIALEFDGATGVELDADGNLIVHTPGGDVVQRAPIVYQTVAGDRRAITGRYVISVNAGDTADLECGGLTPLSPSECGDSSPLFSVHDASPQRMANSNIPATANPGAIEEKAASSRRTPNRVAFEIGPYDPALPLVIDPVLSYSTYLGGSGNDWATDVAVDAAGNAYVGGRTTTDDFPIVSAFQTARGGMADGFVAKLNSAGSAVVYASFLGGAANDDVLAAAVDSAGNLYVTGRTLSSTFPTTAGAFQTSYGGGGTGEFSGDLFVTKINAAGSAKVYSTYLGGSSDDIPGFHGKSIAVDAAGNAYVVGNTSSSDFPIARALQGSYAGGSGAFGSGDAFVAKLASTTTARMR